MSELYERRLEKLKLQIDTMKSNMEETKKELKDCDPDARGYLTSDLEGGQNSLMGLEIALNIMSGIECPNCLLGTMTDSPEYSEEFGSYTSSGCGNCDYSNGPHLYP